MLIHVLAAWVILALRIQTMCCTISALTSDGSSLLGKGAGPKGRVRSSFIQGWAIIPGIFTLSSGFDLSSLLSRSLQSKRKVDQWINSHHTLNNCDQIKWGSSFQLGATLDFAVDFLQKSIAQVYSTVSPLTCRQVIWDWVHLVLQHLGMECSDVEWLHSVR